MIEKINIPTHFRFLSEDEASGWGKTTSNWIPISKIYTRGNDEWFDISTPSFAWVEYDVKNPNLEFKTSKFTKKDLKEFDSDY